MRKLINKSYILVTLVLAFYYSSEGNGKKQTIKSFCGKNYWNFLRRPSDETAI